MVTPYQSNSLQQIHEYRRAAFFGSQIEQVSLKSQFREEAGLLSTLKSQKQAEEQRREQLHTQRCQEVFQQQAEAQRLRDIQRREMQKKIAEDNLMIAEFKKRQNMTADVRDKMEMGHKISESKVKPQAMIR